MERIPPGHLCSIFWYRIKKLPLVTHCVLLFVIPISVCLNGLWRVSAQGSFAVYSQNKVFHSWKIVELFLSLFLALIMMMVTTPVDVKKQELVFIRIRIFKLLELYHIFCTLFFPNFKNTIFEEENPLQSVFSLFYYFFYNEMVSLLT